MAENLGDLGVNIEFDFNRLQALLNRLNQTVQRSSRSTERALSTPWERMQQSAQRSMRNVQRSTARFAQQITRSLKWGAVGFGALTVNAVRLAMAAQETENLFRVSFGNTISEAQNWVNQTAKFYRMNEYNLMKHSATATAILKGMGFSGTESSGMSFDLTKMALDISSFYNISLDRAFDKISSGMIGMARPLQELGILLTENVVAQSDYAKSILATGRALTEEERVRARYLQLQKTLNTVGVTGDAARTRDDATPMLRSTWEQFQKISIQVGQKLLPTLTELLKVIQKLIAGSSDRLVELFKGIGESITEFVRGVDTDQLINFIHKFIDGLKVLFNVLKSIIGWIIDNPKKAIAAFVGMKTGLFQGIGTAIVHGITMGLTGGAVWKGLGIAVAKGWHTTMATLAKTFAISTSKKFTKIMILTKAQAEQRSMLLSKMAKQVYGGKTKIYSVPPGKMRSLHMGLDKNTIYVKGITKQIAFWGKIKNALSSVLKIAGKLSTIFTKIYLVISIIKNLYSFFENMYYWIQHLYKGSMLESVIKKATSFISTVAKSIKNAFVIIADQFKFMFKPITDLYNSVTEWVADTKKYSWKEVAKHRNMDEQGASEHISRTGNLGERYKAIADSEEHKERLKIQRTEFESEEERLKAWEEFNQKYKKLSKEELKIREQNKADALRLQAQHREQAVMFQQNRIREIQEYWNNFYQQQIDNVNNIIEASKHFTDALINAFDSVQSFNQQAFQGITSQGAVHMTGAQLSKSSAISDDTNYLGKLLRQISNDIRNQNKDKEYYEQQQTGYSTAEVFEY